MAETFLYLTTIGHKSGNPHTIEIWYVEHEGNYYLMSEHGDKSHWVQNLLKNPQVQFSVGTRDDKNALVPHRNAVARTITSENAPDILEAVNTKMHEKYNWGDSWVIEVTSGGLKP